MNRGSKPGKYLGQSIPGTGHSQCKSPGAMSPKDSKCQEDLMSEREKEGDRVGAS